MNPRHVNGALLLYQRPAFFPDAATITDHIDAFGHYSRFPFFKWNTDKGCPVGLPGLEFDAIVLHYSVFASGPNDYLLGDDFIDFIDRSENSYKVAFFQDEHQYCQKRFAFLDRHQIDCVYTCLEPEYFDATYGHYTNVPRLVSHVPAYVSSDMVAVAESLVAPEAKRPIDIGYRARPTPPYFGRGGMEKMEIGDRFGERAADSGLVLDISTREEDRFYGKDWMRFIAGSRGFLGTESGASCVDLEDEVRLEYERLAAAGPEPTVEQMEQGALGRWDGRVQLRTTSSRHFEAAALRVCQVMYEGRYSEALQADEHYIALKKDFSNFDDVLARFRDPAEWRRITDNAHRDLIASGAHSYRRFIEGFDQVLLDAGLTPPGTALDPAVITAEIGKPPYMMGVARVLNGISYWLGRRSRVAQKVYLLTAKAAFLVIAVGRFAVKQLRSIGNPA